MPKSILITLDNSLQLWRRFGNGQPVELLLEHTGGRYLNLAEQMPKLWAETIAPELPGDIFFILGPRSGFTDARMVYLWLRSSELFVGTRFYVHAGQVALNFADYTPAEIDEYLAPIRRRNNRELVYPRRPRIGPRKI